MVAGISPWNGAHVLAWRMVVNPPAFGNTVVLKPSVESPVSAGLLIPEIMEEAGFPAGVINVVTHAPGEAVPITDEFTAPKVLVERPVYESFVHRLVKRAASLTIGDPAADGTVIGPLINATALNRVSGEVQEALDAGARLLTGGSADGPCYRPTVLADVAGGRAHPHRGDVRPGARRAAGRGRRRGGGDCELDRVRPPRRAHHRR